MSIELRQAAEQVLEAFETFGEADDFASLFALTQKMNALRDTLAQPATPEPVADGLPLIVAGAIFDFAGFLTTRAEVIEVGSTANAGPVADLVKEWAELRGLNLADAAVLSWQLHITRASLPTHQTAAPEPIVDVRCEGCGYMTHHREHMGCVRAAKQHTHPAPSVPADVVRDAERYRWLAGYCRSTSEHWGGRWSIIIDGPAPKTHDSEDDLDDAIDSAMLAAKDASA